MKNIVSGDSFKLEYQQLRAVVLTPWSSLYSRTRFNHSAFISEVRYKDILFTQKEQDQPGAKSTGGSGLCSEYKCPGMEDGIRAGEQWLKPGIGVLERKNEGWNHLDERRTEGLRTFVTADSRSAVFNVESPKVNGFAYRETRTITLSEDTIRLDIALTNTGDQPLELYDYCHNFISLGEEKVGPTYHLRLPVLAETERNFENRDMIQEPGGVTWRKTPVQPFFRISYDTVAGPKSWELYSSNSAISVSEHDSFHPEHIAVWGTDYCVSAEIYHRICPNPGETATWRREWTFRTG